MSNLKKSDRTKVEILDASWDLIVESGAAVSLAEVAKAVGMTRQSIYVHFGSRSGLLLALVRRADVRFEIWENFERAMTNDTPRGRFDAVLRAWAQFVPKIRPVATDLIRLRSTDADADAAWVDRMTDLHSFFRRLVSDLQGEGELTEGWTVDDATDYLWAAVSMQTWNLLVMDRGWTDEKVAETIHKTVSTIILR